MIRTTANVDHAVTEAMFNGIYLMSIKATSMTAQNVIDAYNACLESIRRHEAWNLSVVVRKTIAHTTPGPRAVVIIVYDRDRPNPYMTYGFRHQTVIFRDSWRLVEQTVQLIYDAIEHRPELSDVIITIGGISDNHSRYRIVICRGTNTFKRGKPAVPAVQSPEPLEDKYAYMRRMLIAHGNTVVASKLIKKHGIEGAEEILTKQTGKRIYIRKVDPLTDFPFYIAEDEKRRRHD